MVQQIFSGFALAAALEQRCHRAHKAMRGKVADELVLPRFGRDPTLAACDRLAVDGQPAAP